MKIIYICLLALFFIPLQSWSKELDLFFIQRSKNKNEVHYRLDVGENCRIASKEPVTGFWKMLEKGPNAIKTLSGFDLLAYKAENQKVNNNWVHFNIKGLKNRLIKATTIYDQKSNKCSPMVQVRINEEWALLNRIYISSKEDSLIPRIMYIDIVGKSLGSISKQVAERVEP